MAKRRLTVCKQHGHLSSYRWCTSCFPPEQRSKDFDVIIVNAGIAKVMKGWQKK